MKKIFSLLSGIMLLCILPAKAQMDSLFIDTVEINTSFEHMVDSCFEHLDLNEVPTGLLLEKAYATIDVKGFNGTCHDSNTQSYDISQLAAGMYQIIVEQNGHILHKQKIVVSR